MIDCPLADERESHEPDSIGERRGAQRHSMMLQAELTAAGPGATVVGRVRNISDTGVRVVVPAGLPTGATVSVRLRGALTVAGTIVAQGPDFVAIQFESPIDVAALLQPRPSARVTPIVHLPVARDARRPGLKRR